MVHFLKKKNSRTDVVVRNVARTPWEIVLRLNDRKMSMDKNVKSGLAGK